MKNTHRLDLPLAALAFLTLLGTVIQALLLLFCYDPTLSLYDRGTPSFTVVVLILLIPILSAALFFILPGGKLSYSKKRTFENHESNEDPSDPSSDPETIIVKIGALFLVIGAVLFGFLLFYGEFAGDPARTLWQSVANGSADSTVVLAGNLIRISAYIGSLAAVYPALLLILGKGRPLPALVTTIWLLLLDMSNYSYNGSFINDPCSTLEIIGLSAAILWLLIEIRRMLGRADLRIYAFLSFSAFALLCISAIPRLIATASGKLNFASTTMIPLALFGIAVMIAGRLIGLRTVSATADLGTDPAPAESAEPEAVPASDPGVAVEDAELPLDLLTSDDPDASGTPDEPDEAAVPDISDEPDVSDISNEPEVPVEPDALPSESGKAEGE